MVTAATTPIDRRSLTRYLAWSVPVIAVAAPAPASAASATCAPVVLDWSQISQQYGTKTIATDGTASTTYGKTMVSYSVSGDTTAPNESTVSSSATGGQSSSLRLYASMNTSGTPTAVQTVTFMFSPAVTDVSFSLLDIDWDGSGYHDQVIVNTPGFTAAKGASVSGAGTAASPFTAPKSVSGGVPSTSTAGNVGLSWSKPLTSVSFTYQQPSGATGSPFIGVSNITFTPTSC